MPTKKIVKKVVKKKKPKRKPYFGMDVQDAVVKYNALDSETQSVERSNIYAKEIHAAFDKLAENIINTFKFSYFDDVFVDVKHEVVAFLVVNMHKYDHTKGSKAFSYFSVVAKNYLILHNNNNYKKYKTHSDISVLNRHTNNDEEYAEFIDDFTNEVINYLEENVNNIFKNKDDIKIAYSIIELLKKRHEIENFNKKAIYILIREMTDVKTSQITRVTNKLKKHYKTMVSRYDKHGTLSSHKFFL